MSLFKFASWSSGTTTSSPWFIWRTVLNGVLVNLPRIEGIIVPFSPFLLNQLTSIGNASVPNPSLNVDSCAPRVPV